MKSKRITGTVKWQSLEMGFWSIIDEKGNEWLPVNMPEQLKKEGRKVTVTLREVDVMSPFMWGTPVVLESFPT